MVRVCRKHGLRAKRDDGTHLLSSYCTPGSYHTPEFWKPLQEIYRSREKGLFAGGDVESQPGEVTCPESLSG